GDLQPDARNEPGVDHGAFAPFAADVVVAAARALRRRCVGGARGCRGDQLALGRGLAPAPRRGARDEARRPRREPADASATGPPARWQHAAGPYWWSQPLTTAATPRVHAQAPPPRRIPPIVMGQE